MEEVVISEELMYKIQQNDEAAIEEVYVKVERFLWYLVDKYKKDGYTLDELFSTCNIGFIKAVRSFDINKGVKFATYLARCCMNEMFMLYRKEKRQLHTVSLFEVISSEEKGELHILDTIKKEYDFDGNINEEAIMDVVTNILIAFPKNKQALIQEALFEGGTERELAKKYGISQSYVSRIIKRFKEKLMQKLIRKGLMDAPVKIKHKGEKKMVRELVVDREYIEKRVNEGATQKEIAAELNAPMNTVGYHVRKITGVNKTPRKTKQSVTATVGSSIPEIEIDDLVTVRGTFELSGEVENASAISKQINYLLALSKNKKATFDFSIRF